MRKLSMDELNRKSVDEFRASEKLPVVAVLENIRSAYNVGSVFRTADAFLLSGVYLCGYTAFPPHKEIKKTALGAEDTVPWKHFRQIGDALADLRAGGYRIFSVEQAVDSIPLDRFHELFSGSGQGADVMNNEQTTGISHPFHQRLAVVFGNEVTGVEQSTIAQCDGCIEIPQLGMKHSLNVSVAAGVVLWELVRAHLAQN